MLSEVLVEVDSTELEVRTVTRHCRMLLFAPVWGRYLGTIDRHDWHDPLGFSGFSGVQPLGLLQQLP